MDNEILDEVDKEAHNSLDKILDMLKKNKIESFNLDTEYNGYNVEIKITKQEK